MLYICRECGHQISSGATRCPYCSAPPRPPLYGRPFSHRLLLRATVVLLLSLPLLMLPVVMRWHKGSWDPCDWAVQPSLGTAAAQGEDSPPPPAETAGATPAQAEAARDSFGGCVRLWLDQVGG